jgi:hypothetical protein
MGNLGEIPERVKEGLEQIPPGFVFFDFLKEEGQSDEEACLALIIKDEQHRLNRLKPVVSVQLVTVGMDIDSIFLIDVMIQFSDMEDTLYEFHINAKDNDWGRLALDRLASQNKLYITFYNEKNEPHRNIVVTNTQRKDFIKFKMRLSEWLQWSDEQFNEAKEKFLKTYPDVYKLWNKYAKKKR